VEQYPGGDEIWNVSCDSLIHPSCLLYTYPLEGGAGYVEYSDTVVTFTRPDSNLIYPTYARHNDDSTKRNYIDLQVNTELGGHPVGNVMLHFRKPTLINSGGHTHGGTRPMARYMLEQQQHPGSYDTLETFDHPTDANGIMRFRFLASEFGGSEFTTVALKSDTTISDTLSFFTRVPGLRLLPAGTHYIKEGGTCDHHGPGGEGACGTPDTDHYGDSLLVKYIPIIADSLAAIYPELTLHVNDLSLPYGGRFDLKGRWGVPPGTSHVEHRIGINADLPVRFMSADTAKENNLQRIINKVTLQRPLDERLVYDRALKKKVRAPHPHFHIYSRDPAK